MSTGLKKLRDLLFELFQFGEADLDFGIYRILRLKRSQVEHFLVKDLEDRVKSAFAHYQSADLKALQSQLDELLQQLQKLKVPAAVIDAHEDVLRLRRQIEAYQNVASIEDEIFARLADFFSRYYEKGDFLARRNYRNNQFAIPYDGEEVKLHWANADQYYIKSTARHAHYSADLSGGNKIRFEVVAGGEERDNAKASKGQERLFQLDKIPYVIDGRRLTLRFIHRADETPGHDQAWHLNKLVELLQTDPKLLQWANALLKNQDESNPGRKVLDRHFDRFRKSESFDYFIHKNLDAFLRRELDHYLKTEVMHLDDIASQTVPRVEEYLSRLKVLRSLGGDIITFLAQVEDFQKRLWLKQKFVLETRWCISMQLVPEDLWPEVLANDAQREAWVSLFAIDKITRTLTQTGYSVPLTVEFLRQQPTLVLDTVHFSREFTERLLARFDDLEAHNLGILFHAENFQALRLMQARFREKIKCTYIDPPYNTGNDGFLYKDNYQHSSWLSMLQNRLALSHGLLSKNGSFFVSIDDIELQRALALLDLHFGDDNRIETFIWKKSYGGGAKERFAVTLHEYAIMYSRDKSSHPHLWLPPDEESISKYYRLTDHQSATRGPYRIKPLEATKSMDAREKLRFDIIFPDGTIAKPKRQWWWGEERVAKAMTNGELLYHKTEDGSISVSYKQYLLDDDGEQRPAKPFSIIDGAFGQQGSARLNDLFGQQIFSFPKSVGLLDKLIRIALPLGRTGFYLDYFAGSGTSADALLSIDDGGRRPFLLVDLAPHFHTVLLPRVQKVMHSIDWKDGIPVSRKGPVGIVQVLALESYDDTLDNLDLKVMDGLQATLTASPDFARDYTLRYQIEHEAQHGTLALSRDLFTEKPFDRTLRVTRDDALTTVPVDLVETFHWLVGLTVRTRRVEAQVRVSRGTLPDGAEAVVLWRDPAVVSDEVFEQWFAAAMVPTLDGVSKVWAPSAAQLGRHRPSNASWSLEGLETTFLARMFDATEA